MVFFYTLIAFLRDKEYRQLLYTTTVTLIIGSVVYHFLEGWTWVDSLYFSVITLSTIGYGDFSPATDAGKVFTIMYIIIGVGIILSFINTIQHHYRETKKGTRKV